MLAVERKHRIFDMLSKMPAVTTVAAAKALAVTGETVRRDFEKLEGGGLLSRQHGGAVRKRSFSCKGVLTDQMPDSCHPHAGVRDVDVLITDQSPERKLKSTLGRNSVKLVVAGEESP